MDTVSIDCASCGDVWALFGSTAGWNRNEDGSKLNNFLTDHSGKRSVVFLDEFDKTDQKVRDALLLIMQNGMSPTSLTMRAHYELTLSR